MAYTKKDNRNKHRFRDELMDLYKSSKRSSFFKDEQNKTSKESRKEWINKIKKPLKIIINPKTPLPGGIF